MRQEMDFREFQTKISDRFTQILLEAYIDPEREVNRPPIALSMGSCGGTFDDPIPIGTYGNFTFVQAPPKSKKTFFVSLLASVYLSGQNEYGGKMKGHRGNRKLIHYDTEQGEYHAHRVFRRIFDMYGSGDDYFSYSLRGYSYKERLEFIDWHISNTNNVGMVIIDGIADLIADVNDIEASNELVQYLMRWTKDFGIHLITVIHSNYNSEKPTGHLGSFLEKKTETQISLTLDEDTDNVLVSCKRSRGVPFDSFEFKVDGAGFPRVIGDLPSEVNDLNFYNI